MAGPYTSTPKTWASEAMTSTDLNAYVRDPIAALDTWTSYTPTWASTGTAPAILNGTLVGRYTQVLKTCFFAVGVTIGSTTTFGTGNYTLTLPLTPSSVVPYWSWLGYGLTGGTSYQLTLDANGGSATAAMNYQSSTAGAKTRVGQTAPATWAAVANNGFWFSGSFMVA